MKTKDDLQALLKQAQELNERTEKAFNKEKEREEKGLGAIGQGSQGSNYSHPVVGGTSDEKQCLMAFGCKSVQELINVNTGLPRYSKVKPYFKHMVRELKNSVDSARWIAQFFHGGAKDRIGAHEAQDHVARVKNIGDTYYGKHDLMPRLKAFGSTTPGAGDEWVPTLLSSSYVEEYELEHAVEDKFMQQTMQSNPWELPTQDTLNKARIIGENAQISDTTFQTGKLTFTATKLGEHHILPEEMTEDSAPDIMAAARDHVVRAQIRAVESALLNGDDDGTHIDSDTQAGGADLAEKAWKGLRRQALANSANGGTHDYGNAAVTDANLRSQRAKMKKFGAHPSELLWIAGPVVYIQMLGLPDVVTIDKFGQNATVVKGSLANYQGIPIVNSEHMREDLSDLGVYDGVTIDRAGILLVNLRRWYVGIRRPIRVKAMADLPYYDRFLLASYQRKDFVGHAQDASEVSVSFGINIAV